MGIISRLRTMYHNRTILGCQAGIFQVNTRRTVIGCTCQVDIVRDIHRTVGDLRTRHGGIQREVACADVRVLDLNTRTRQRNVPV
ncbi:hypothetical protein, partial [Escherichia coli]|uniref:hypothetical protein n=1 Tax=Escherichia coli TaxID=562 RepID=UPI00237A13DD